MSISLVLDELLSTGWSGLDSTGCSYDATGRAYPGVERVKNEFAAAGFQLEITEIPAFRCCRAQWHEAGSNEGAGSVIAATREEAAVHALAQLRRALATA